MLLTRLGVIGDFSSIGNPGPTSDVSTLVKSWNPDAIITVGDNNYPAGEASTIDGNIGQWYHDYIYPYTGTYGAGSPNATNRFWPALGNHDLDSANGQAYYNFFTLPNNERYYTTTIGDIAIFVINSDPREVDGIASDSVQGDYIRQQMQASTAKWKLVVAHHPPYSSGDHGNTPALQWPFKEWGATAVLTGHDHEYERLRIDGMTYFVNGLGGRSLVPGGPPINGSQVRYYDDYGGMLIDSTSTTITFKFITRTGLVIDTYTYDPSLEPVTQTLIPTNAAWKYLDNGTNQGTAWRNLGFNDASWLSGAAELGYGDGDEATLVSYGPNASLKYITTYFRKSFTVANASAISALELGIKRDDGAVVYLNGTEVFRTNMTSGSFNYLSTASASIEDDSYYPATFSSSLLQNGNNVIAVEVHQGSGSSSDMSFNFKLIGTLTPQPATSPNLNGVAVNTSPLTLDWADAATATSYDIYLGNPGVFYTTVTASQLTNFIPPADGLQYWSVVSRNALGGAAGPLWSFTFDATPPTATLGAQLPVAGAPSLDFTISYADVTSGVNTSTFDNSDITVTGPGGFSAGAQFISAVGSVATYRIVAPGGFWNLSDNGTYTVSQNASQVRDTANNARPPGAIGTLVAATPFAWTTVGSNTLHVEFDGSSTPITLGGSGQNLTVTRSSISLPFANVSDIDVTGTALADTLELTGGVTVPLSFSNDLGADTVRVIAGTYTFATALAPALHNIAIVIDAAAKGILGADQRLRDLTVMGQLDLQDHDIIIDAASPGGWNGSEYIGLSGSIQAGRNGGAWNGNGLITSQPDALGFRTTLAIAQASEVLSIDPSATALWQSQTISGSSVLIKYTYSGDANLDGKVDADDYAWVDLYTVTPSSNTYVHGDFNYSGTINADDYALIDLVFLNPGEIL